MHDSQIIDLYWKRSDRAIKETDKKYGRLCLYVAKNILANIEDAKEVVSDTYLGTWNAIPPARPNVLSAFLCRITKNIALTKYDYNTAKKRNPEVLKSLSELDEIVSGIEDPQQQYEAIELARIINDFLKLLDYERRNIFLRRYWYYDSISSIASRFSMSESKVKSMLFRTRNKLKVYLFQEGVLL